MIDKNEEGPGHKTPDSRPQKGRILRAKDIIPGFERSAGPDEAEAAKFGIPQFNLSRDLMSGQRRQNANRRKGPEATEDRGQRAEDGRQKTEDRRQNTEYRIMKKTGWQLVGGIEALRDSIIAEIVTRDIERLCAGH